MTPSEEVQKLLDKHGIKYTIDDSEYYEIIEWQGPYNLWWQFLYDPYDEEPYGEIRLRDIGTATHIRPEQAIAVTLGRSCESCPEMDNPDSYIRHLQSALKWHDEHVPRPTNPRNTCVVLKGEKPPEEVLFVGPDGVTHYQPEGATADAGTPRIEERHGDWYCTGCGEMVGTCDVASELYIDGNAIDLWCHCPRCGRRIEVSE